MLERVLIGLVVLLWAAAPAVGQEPEPITAWDAEMTVDGQPRFWVWDRRDQTVTVHRCPGGDPCGDALPSGPSMHYSMRAVDVSGIAAGDVV